MVDEHNDMGIWIVIVIVVAAVLWHKGSPTNRTGNNWWCDKCQRYHTTHRSERYGTFFIACVGATEEGISIDALELPVANRREWQEVQRVLRAVNAEVDGPEMLLLVEDAGGGRGGGASGGGGRKKKKNKKKKKKKKPVRRRTSNSSRTDAEQQQQEAAALERVRAREAAALEKAETRRAEAAAAEAAEATRRARTAKLEDALRRAQDAARAGSLDADGLGAALGAARAALPGEARGTDAYKAAAAQLKQMRKRAQRNVAVREDAAAGRAAAAAALLRPRPAAARKRATRKEKKKQRKKGKRAPLAARNQGGN